MDFRYFNRVNHSSGLLKILCLLPQKAWRDR